jgi:ethanolaminephosphotransferase
MASKLEKLVQSASYIVSSSPLGMLFDHGADAVSSFLLAMQVMKICQLSYGFQLVAVYVLVMNLYFCAMWSQYCVGYFKLGRINPVDEGLPMYAIFCLVASQIDFKTQHIYGTYGEEFILSLFIIAVPQTIYMVKDIMKNKIVSK